MSEAWSETQIDGFLIQWLICMYCDIKKDVPNSVADTYTSVTKI